MTDLIFIYTHEYMVGMIEKLKDIKMEQNV